MIWIIQSSDSSWDTAASGGRSWARATDAKRGSNILESLRPNAKPALNAQPLERDDPAGVPGSRGFGAGRPDDQPVGARHHLDERGILQVDRRRREPSIVAPSRASSACSPGAARWPEGRQRGGRAWLGSAPASGSPCSARRSGRRNRIAQTMDEVGFPGRPEHAHAAQPPVHQRLAGPHRDPPETELHAGGESAFCTRSWSPTDAPPRVTSTSASASRARRIA